MVQLFKGNFFTLKVIEQALLLVRRVDGHFGGDVQELEYAGDQLPVGGHLLSVLGQIFLLNMCR